MQLPMVALASVTVCQGLSSTSSCSMGPKNDSVTGLSQLCPEF